MSLPVILPLFDGAFGVLLIPLLDEGELTYPPPEGILSVRTEAAEERFEEVFLESGLVFAPCPLRLEAADEREEILEGVVVTLPEVLAVGEVRVAGIEALEVRLDELDLEDELEGLVATEPLEEGEELTPFLEPLGVELLEGDAAGLEGVE